MITMDKSRNASKALVIVQLKKDAAGTVAPAYLTSIQPGEMSKKN
jgi:hypothetical protein